MKLMRQVIEHHREYHQFDRKRKYANRTYERKKQFYGQEKPDEYDLLVKHYRRAILEAINQIPNHKRKILQDKYFVVTYDTKSRVFEILGLKNAQVHRDKDHRGRLQEISSKKNYLHNRLKFRNTAMLEEFGYELQKYAFQVQEAELALENAMVDSLEDVLALLLYNVAFLPVGTSRKGRIDRSLEIKSADLAHTTWLDAKGGVSMEGFTESLLKDSLKNGLATIGYAVHESEYGDGGSIDQHDNLKTAIQEFITRYTSSSAYFNEKKMKHQAMERHLYKPNTELQDKFHMYVDKRNVRLLLVTIDEILNERDAAQVNKGDSLTDIDPMKRNFYGVFMPKTMSVSILDEGESQKNNMPVDLDQELPF